MPQWPLPNLIKNFTNFHVLFPKDPITDDMQGPACHLGESRTNYSEFIGWFDTALEAADHMKTAALAMTPKHMAPRSRRSAAPAASATRSTATR